MAKVSPGAFSSLKEKIDAVTGKADGAPGVVFCVVNKDGDLVFEHASGKVGLGKKEPMTMNSVFWIASCTKMITGIACMQLVEQGKLTLDDAEVVEKLAPELKAVKVIDEDGKMVEKKKGVSLRMLLSHTAGFGYSFWQPKLIDYDGKIGIDEFSGRPEDCLSQPLVNHPGEVWEYGVNLDWAGELVERASGLSLNEYFQKYIFKPMGIQNINMFPTEEMKKKLVYMHTRSPEGKLSLHPGGHLHRRPLVASTSEEINATFNSGGAGCFGTPADYCQIIATLLNDGTHPKSGTQILKLESVKEMFTNQIPDMPNFGRQGIHPPKLDLSNPIPDLYPEPDAPPQGWGLSFLLHLRPLVTGAAAGTARWAGLANLYWWADRETGLGGFIASQILPFADATIGGLYVDMQRGVYEAIK